MSEFKDLLGKTLVKVEKTEDNVLVFFQTEDGSVYHLYHDQYCCENVYVESVVGDLEDLIGQPLLQAEEVNSVEEEPVRGSEESYTWTFYKLATIKGSVTIRWFGSSNGYYSESVSFDKVN